MPELAACLALFASFVGLHRGTFGEKFGSVQSYVVWREVCG